jgi:FkbM family methyltransferase
MLLTKNAVHYPNITPVMKGLWAYNTRIFIENPDFASWGFRAVESETEDPASIEALGITDVLQQFALPRIDVLKIDIEGGEYEVFKNDVSDWIDRVEMLAIEVHDRVRPGCSEAVRNALVPYGFVESKWCEYLVFKRQGLHS